MTEPVAVVTGIRRFRPGDEASILTLLQAAHADHPSPGVTAHDIVRAVDRLAADPSGTAVALEGDRIVGVTTPRHDALTVHPAHRRRGHGRRLVAEALDIARESGDPELVLWGDPARPEADAFIRALGFTYRSSLWLFRLPPSTAVSPPAFPPDVVTRTYRPADLEAYVELVNAAFADHPVRLAFPLERVRYVHALPDFDPEGILLVASVDEPDRNVAFVRVELFPADDGSVEGYVGWLGTLPAWRKRGLGRELLRWGVAHVRSSGVGVVELQVEAANDRALRLYLREGFEPAVEWPHWGLPLPVQPPSGGGQIPAPGR